MDGLSEQTFWGIAFGVLLLLLALPVLLRFRKFLIKSAVPGGVVPLQMEIGMFVAVFTMYALLNLTLHSSICEFMGVFQRFSGMEEDVKFVVANFLSQGILLLVVSLFAPWGTFMEEAAGNARTRLVAVGSAIYNSATTFLIVAVSLQFWIGILDFLAKGARECVASFLEPTEQPTVEVFARIGENHVAILLLVAVVIFAPIIEEVIFRGLVYRILKWYAGKNSANIITAAVFAAAHFNLQVFVPLFIFSMCLVEIYERTGDLREVICVHSLFNVLSIVGIIHDA
ncbi:MAG: CPBP family intramembrane metalloprotease [Puniceicoccales bacterium]|jgi:membrane protease YdiL (CAAX protease family)|nr:CPBP family intramembrane metalloprotease [Puniceicoccales bacterium]